MFGTKKMVLFMLGLPTVIFTKRNRSAYKFMGECYTLLNGKKIFWKHPDVRFIDEIFYQKCYTPDHGFVIKENYTVVDLGANIGVFTLFAASHASKGRIYSVEADKKEFKRLNENVANNDLKNILTINAAISDTVGEVNFSNGRITDKKKRRGKKYYFEGKIKSITINELLKRYEIKKIDFLKMDIEGTEYNIFNNKDWLDNVNMIAMELHKAPSGHHENEIIEILRLKKFDVTTINVDEILYCYAKKSI